MAGDHEASDTDSLLTVDDRSLTPSRSPTPSRQQLSTNLVDHPTQPSARASNPTQLAINVASTESSKDDDGPESAPYGTRSRNRTNVTRPNYREEPDMEVEYASLKLDNAAPRRLTPPNEYQVGGMASSLPASGGWRAANVNPLNGHATTSEASTPVPTAEVAPERKKRKYERHAPKVQQNRNSPANGKESAIPGTSQFYAAPNGSSEAPPTKKRKAINGQAMQAASPATPPAASATTTLAAARPTKLAMRVSGVVSFEKSGYLLNSKGQLVSDDGEAYSVDDHAYLVCEPPGDPYYLCRIMEFRHAEPDNPKSPVRAMLVNWYYRPKDIQRYSSDYRCVFASMHSDESPITSLRGKCQIKHRSDIANFEEYRKERDTFWFNQLFDRYIHRQYEIIPSSSVINVPERVKAALDERWKFIVVEPAKMKELTSAIKLCKRCNKYCAPNDSVDCGVCRNTWHMTCVRPPILKKPTRGFAWSCGSCTKAQEIRLEQRNATVLAKHDKEAEDELVEEDEDENAANAILKRENADVLEDLPGAQAEIARAKMWPWRYLGLHARVEDVLQYDDRAIYPRACSRTGARYQAMVPMWYGRAVELVKPIDVKRKYNKSASNKKDAKLTKDTIAALEAEKIERAKRPKWVQDEPAGYVGRGEDYDESDPNCTATRLFIMPQAHATSGFAAVNSTSKPTEKTVDDYMQTAKTLIGIAATGISPSSTNLLDRALITLQEQKFNSDAALKELRKIQGPRDIGDPVLTKEELKKFEDGVQKFGSELRLVRKNVKTRPYGELVRFYYNWKKTKKGREIWGHYDGRRGTKRKAETSWTELADEEDDSAFDNGKLAKLKRQFECKVCLTRTSRQWRRAPNIAPGATVGSDTKVSHKDKLNQLIVALCQRCAIIWRKYAMRWEDPEEIAKAMMQTGVRAWKRKTDEDLLREYVWANELANVPTVGISAVMALAIGVPVTEQAIVDPAKKKVKAQETEGTPQVEQQVVVKKKAIVPPPRPPTPPIVPQPPTMKALPCAVCGVVELTISCNSCRLTVHRHCYGIPEQVNIAKFWSCDTCVNDKTPQDTMRYKCVLCPATQGNVELWEPPKQTHKKKTDRDRERERLEKILLNDMVEDYRRKQTEKGRPTVPREVVKRTANNNWIHVTCAVWTPEIRFSDAINMKNAEGVGAVIALPTRMDPSCHICGDTDMSCISCHMPGCNAVFHVGCAHNAGYIFGFDITPVKGARKDSVNTVTIGPESGSMTAAVWCKEHEGNIKTIVHAINESAGDGLTAIEKFVRMYKQADLTSTGTARKANLLSQSFKTAAAPIASSSSRRGSTMPNGTHTNKSRESPSQPSSIRSVVANETALVNGVEQRHTCVACALTSSVKWWPVSDEGVADVMEVDHVPAVSGQTNGSHQAVNGYRQNWQCHKCHMRQKIGLPRRLSTSGDDNILPEVTTTPDYFALTARPPSPPPPVVTTPLNALPWTPGAHLQNMHPLTNPITHPSVHPDDAHDMDVLARSRVRLTNLVGATRVFMGHEWGGLERGSEIFRSLKQVAETALGFDASRQIIRTEDGSPISTPKALIDVLVKIIQEQRMDSHWQIVNVDALARQQYITPPHALGMSGQFNSLQPVAPSPSSRLGAIAPNQPRPLPPLNPLSRQQQPLGGGLNIAPRAAPYFGQGSPHTPGSGAAGSAAPLSGLSRYGVPAAIAPQPLGGGQRQPDLREQQPPPSQQQQQAGTGASMSPNLRNLMH